MIRILSVIKAFNAEFILCFKHLSLALGHIDRLPVIC